MILWICCCNQPPPVLDLNASTPRSDEGSTHGPGLQSIHKMYQMLHSISVCRDLHWVAMLEHARPARQQRIARCNRSSKHYLIKLQVTTDLITITPAIVNMLWLETNYRSYKHVNTYIYIYKCIMHCIHENSIKRLPCFATWTTMSQSNLGSVFPILVVFSPWTISSHKLSYARIKFLPPKLQSMIFG